MHDTRLIQSSNLYESIPLGPKFQPNFINAVVEMIVSLDQQRQFELNVKLIKIAKDIDEAASNLMRMPQ